MNTETAQQTLARLPLAIWEKLLIMAGSGYEAGTYVGRIEDFADGGIIVSAPEFVAGNILLREGMSVTVQVVREDALYEFDSKISKEVVPIPGQVWLASPGDVRRVQRRLFVRVEWKDEITYARLDSKIDWALFPHCCVWYRADQHDVSASGLRISDVTNSSVGDLFLVRMPRLRAQGFPEYAFAVCRRRFDAEGAAHLGLEFILAEHISEYLGRDNVSDIPSVARGFSALTQDKLVVWIFQRQIELRQKGLL